MILKNLIVISVSEFTKKKKMEYVFIIMLTCNNLMYACSVFFVGFNIYRNTT